MTHALDERSQSILLELVRDHIEKAEPVGSRSLAKSHFNKLSPATIRNVMSDLEEMGYLHQPHRSAGRIPTDQGYRFFVNHIIGFPNLENLNILPEDDERIFRNCLQPSVREFPSNGTRYATKFFKYSLPPHPIYQRRVAGSSCCVLFRIRRDSE